MSWNIRITLVFLNLNNWAISDIYFSWLYLPESLDLFTSLQEYYVILLQWYNPSGLWLHFLTVLKTSNRHRSLILTLELYKLQNVQPVLSKKPSNVYRFYQKNKLPSSFSCIPRQSLSCTCYTGKQHAFSVASKYRQKLFKLLKNDMRSMTKRLF